MPDANSSAARLASALAALAILFLSGCASQAPESTASPTPTTTGVPGTVILLAEAPQGSNDQGAPGNTMFFDAFRQGATLTAGFDNYWEQTAYVAKINPANQSTQRVPLANRDSSYAEHFTIGTFQERTILSYRLGTDRLIVHYQQEDATWIARSLTAGVDRDPQGPILVAYPQLATSGDDLFLGHIVSQAINAGYRVHNVTGLFSDGQTTSKTLSADIPHLPTGFLSGSPSGMLAAFSNQPGSVAVVHATWDSTWSTKRVYEAPTPQDTASFLHLAAAQSPTGTPHVVLLARPDGNTGGSTPHPVLLGSGPDWIWKDTGVRAIELGGAAVVGEKITFVVRTDLGNWELVQMPALGSAETVLRASCPMRAVTNSTQLEAVALRYAPSNRTHQLVWIRDPALLAGTDPCAA